MLSVVFEPLYLLSSSTITKKKKKSFFGIIYMIYNFFWEQLEK